MRKVLSISLMTLAATAMLVLLGFINHVQKHQDCKAIQIRIHQNGPFALLHESDIWNVVTTYLDTNALPSLSELHIDAMEADISRVAYVRQAEVYVTVNGTLCVDVVQRQPFVRVFNTRGKSAYIDREGYIIPSSSSRPAHVPVASGHITDPLVPGSRIVADEMGGLATTSMLQRILELAICIDSDPLLAAQVQQMYVNENKEIEIIPRVGNHTIVIGESEPTEIQLAKLKLLYHKGFTEADWNRFSKIDLSYKDQIVCTKK